MEGCGFDELWSMDSTKGKGEERHQSSLAARPLVASCTCLGIALIEDEKFDFSMSDIR